MKEFLLNHIGTIGALFGVICVVVVFNTVGLWRGTKYETAFIWLLIMSTLIGAGVTAEAFFKWLVK